MHSNTITHIMQIHTHARTHALVHTLTHNPSNGCGELMDNCFCLTFPQKGQKQSVFFLKNQTETLCYCATELLYNMM